MLTDSRPPTLRSALWNHSNFLSSLSLSTLIVAHRLLYRFFYQLRSNLQLPEALQFRTKYPNASKLFLSPKSPSLAASIAGFALLLHPATDRRVSIAVYALIKALEFLYNQYEDAGYFINRPWVCHPPQCYFPYQLTAPSGLVPTSSSP
jgi:hypothetical protein